MGEHDQQPTDEQDQREELSHSDDSEAAAEAPAQAVRDTEEMERESLTAAQAFVDELDAADEWEVLNAQADVALHLHSQMTRFLQVLLTMIGIGLTGIAVLGPSTIAASLSLENIDVTASGLSRVSIVLIGVIILRHGFELLLNGFMLVMLIGFRLVLGLTIYPALGDSGTQTAGKAEWIRANQVEIGAVEDELSDGYSHLFWLFLHALVVLLLYYGLLSPGALLLYGLPLSLGLMFSVTVAKSIPETADDREEFSEELKVHPVRLLRVQLQEEYRTATRENDSYVGTARHLIWHGGNVLWLVVHAAFVLLIMFGL